MTSVLPAPSQFEIRSALADVSRRCRAQVRAPLCLAESNEPMPPMPFEHPNPTHSYFTIDMDGDGLACILVITTDLKLNALDPGYDPEKVDSLVKAATEFQQANIRAVDGVRIVPAR